MSVEKMFNFKILTLDDQLSRINVDPNAPPQTPSLPQLQQRISIPGQQGNMGRRMTEENALPEIRKYKTNFQSNIHCASLWGVNLLVGCHDGLKFLDRSGGGEVYTLSK